jgi:hypothetical protein
VRLARHESGRLVTVAGIGPHLASCAEPGALAIQLIGEVDVLAGNGIGSPPRLFDILAKVTKQTQTSPAKSVGP